MATDKKPTMLRLPEDVYEKVRFLAYLEHRSINAEIEHALACYINMYEQQHGTISVPEQPTNN